MPHWPLIHTSLHKANQQQAAANTRVEESQEIFSFRPDSFPLHDNFRTHNLFYYKLLTLNLLNLPFFTRFGPKIK